MLDWARTSMITVVIILACHLK